MQRTLLEKEERLIIIIQMIIPSDGHTVRIQKQDPIVIFLPMSIY